MALVLMMKGYLLFTIGVVLVYSLRHFIFTLNRLFGPQRIYYHDLMDSDLKTVTVIIPMHNEEKVAGHILDQLLQADYDWNKLEIIPINDFSSDGTQEILDLYASRYPQIKPLHRAENLRGKPAALNDALQVAQGEVIVVFDADYLPPPGIICKIAVCFNDPEVGAVMGRVIPINTGSNTLTRLLDLERSGGYQVDQQARYNLGLIPQYGGTVGGFRKDVVVDLGSFNTQVLAEDTELTFRLLLHGWKVVYANQAECYEESPETWQMRSRQIKRWSRGHNRVFFNYLIPLLRSSCLSLREKTDGVLLLMTYCVPLLLLLGFADSVALFFCGEIQIFSGILFLLFMAAYTTFGNFAPFYQIGTACLLDGSRQRVLLLNLLLFLFFFNTWYISCGFMEAVVDSLTSRRVPWNKTERYRCSA